MRTTIEVIGVGQRKSGISKKNNRPYDMTDISFKYDHQQFRGVKAETVAFPADVIGTRQINPGDILEVEMFQLNFKTHIACIYG